MSDDEQRITHKEYGISVKIEIGDGPGQVTREEWEAAKAIWGIREDHDQAK